MSVENFLKWGYIKKDRFHADFQDKGGPLDLLEHETNMNL